jgi:deoxyribonucleoside regulator
MLRGRLPDATKEAIFHAAARAAAQYLDETLLEREVLCLAWGRVVHAVLQFLHPKQPRPGLVVVPLLGVLSAQPDWFEANALVQTAAAAYQGRRYFCLPIPAIVRDARQKQIAMELPLVRAALAEMQKASFVVTSIAPPDAKKSTVVKRRLLEPAEIKSVKERGAIGEICAWWFNERGEPVPDERIQPIGLGLDGLKRLVARNRTVMAVVAADPTRVAPLHAAIRGKLVNVVVTDHVTGEELLRRAGGRP